METKWDLRFLKLARLISTYSKDPSTQTGAVIVAPDRHIVSTGFNGFPQDMDDIPSLYANREEKLSRIIHCEINALIFARCDLWGTTLYTYPFLSCDRCCVQMLQAGVSYFVSLEPTAEALSRWGEAFNRTKLYIEECGRTWKEYKEIDNGNESTK